MLTSIFLAMSQINGTLQKNSIGSLIAKMTKYKVFGDESFLKKLFSYQNRKFSLDVGEAEYQIMLEKQNKLILCQVDLAKMDINF